MTYKTIVTEERQERQKRHGYCRRQFPWPFHRFEPRRFLRDRDGQPRSLYDDRRCRGAVRRFGCRCIEKQKEKGAEKKR